MSIPSMLGMVGIAAAFDALDGMFGIVMELVFMAAKAVETAVIVMAVAIVIDSIESISRGSDQAKVGRPCSEGGVSGFCW